MFVQNIKKNITEKNAYVPVEFENTLKYYVLHEA
jgi:hypothetical protein